MGLDMSLYRKAYVRNYKHTKPEERHTVTVSREAGTAIKPERIAYITEYVAYWRKANQIHKWFVDTTQEGKDEGQESDVSRAQLLALLDLCKQVLADHALAKKLLPTQSGFFFGSTEYDEGYYKDLEDTISMLEPLLAETGDEWIYSFHYSASW